MKRYLPQLILIDLGRAPILTNMKISVLKFRMTQMVTAGTRTVNHLSIASVLLIYLIIDLNNLSSKEPFLENLSQFNTFYGSVDYVFIILAKF